MRYSAPLLLVLIATPAVGESARQMSAHVHGVGQLNIAAAGKTVAMEFTAPGADIVGFEHAAKTDEDKAAINEAVAILANPPSLFALPRAAECLVTSATAELESEHGYEARAEHDDNDEHGHVDHGHDEHEDHADDDHDKEAHEDHDHSEHDHEEHAHKDEDHSDHDHGEHDEHGHEEHAEDEGGHTEFHAEYMLTCQHPEEITQIEFLYFGRFENALEVDVQIISQGGAKAFEVERGAPILDTSGLF